MNKQQIIKRLSEIHKEVNDMIDSKQERYVMKHEEGGRTWHSIITREVYLEHCLEALNQDLIMLEVDVEDSL